MISISDLCDVWCVNTQGQLVNEVNIYDFDEDSPESDAYDISACFNDYQSIDFEMAFSSKFHLLKILWNVFVSQVPFRLFQINFKSICFILEWKLFSPQTL